jgi:hypothetical protein
MTLDPIHALHNAARRYCSERAAHWAAQERELARAGRWHFANARGQYENTDEAWSIFPRNQLLFGILRDVERVVPGDFSTVSDLRTMLIEAGTTAPASFWKSDRPSALQAIEDERQRFVEYVRYAEIEALATLPVVPCRRLLSQAECETRRAAFALRWGTWNGGRAEPVARERGTLTLRAAVLHETDAEDRLRRVLKDRGVVQLIELLEFGDGYELELDGLILYSGAETCWTSGEMDWMFNTSHESTVTFGGEWLVEAMRAYLPRFRLPYANEDDLDDGP